MCGGGLLCIKYNYRAISNTQGAPKSSQNCGTLSNHNFRNLKIVLAYT